MAVSPPMAPRIQPMIRITAFRSRIISTSLTDVRGISVCPVGYNFLRELLCTSRTRESGLTARTSPWSFAPSGSTIEILFSTTMAANSSQAIATCLVVNSAVFDEPLEDLNILALKPLNDMTPKMIQVSARVGR